MLSDGFEHLPDHQVIGDVEPPLLPGSGVFTDDVHRPVTVPKDEVKTLMGDNVATLLDSQPAGKLRVVVHAAVLIDGHGSETGTLMGIELVQVPAQVGVELTGFHAKACDHVIVCGCGHAAR